MASNELRACRKAIKYAKSKDDILIAVDILDAACNIREVLMKPKDWVRLTNLIVKVNERLDNES